MVRRVAIYGKRRRRVGQINCEKCITSRFGGLEGFSSFVAPHITFELLPGNFLIPHAIAETISDGVFLPKKKKVEC